MAVLIFILFLGPLVFFHELGHFLFARFFGVKVETFSIGFGPKIFKYKPGETEYCISLIPLGGYVKMFGDDPSNKEGIPEEKRHLSFLFKSKMARFWIVFGGPLANLILAFALFFGLTIVGSKIPGIQFGQLSESSHFYKQGLRAGDLVVKVNGKDVVDPSDISLVGAPIIKTVTVKRRGGTETLELRMGLEEFFTKYGMVSQGLRRPIVIDRTGKSNFLSFSNNKIDTNISLEELLQNSGQKELYVLKKDAGKVTIVETISASPEGLNTLERLNQLGYFPKDLVIKEVVKKSAGSKAGLVAGDVIYQFNGKALNSFSTLRSELQKITTPSVTLGIIRGAKQLEITLAPQIRKIKKREVKLIGVVSNGEFFFSELVTVKPKGVFDALGTAFSKTFTTTVGTFANFFKLFTFQASLKSIGGPISIGKVAYHSFQLSPSYFLKLMAIISIALGVLNLLPIPVLDGGHIMFLIAEAIKGSPLSLRKIEIAQQVGLSILLILMSFALYNDIANWAS
jgi:regulator of sigma E protease